MSAYRQQKFNLPQVTYHSRWVLISSKSWISLSNIFLETSSHWRGKIEIPSITYHSRWELGFPSEPYYSRRVLIGGRKVEFSPGNTTSNKAPPCPVWFNIVPFEGETTDVIFGLFIPLITFVQGPGLEGCGWTNVLFHLFIANPNKTELAATKATPPTTAPTMIAVLLSETRNIGPIKQYFWALNCQYFLTH